MKAGVPVNQRLAGTDGEDVKYSPVVLYVGIEVIESIGGSEVGKSVKRPTPFSKIRPGSPHKSRQKSTGFPAQKSTLVTDFVSAEAFGFRT